jgi:hypothetical protein
MIANIKIYTKYILALALVSIALSNSADPPNGRTGAPGDSACTACHSGNNFEGNIEITGLPDIVESGNTYVIGVRVDNTDGNAVRSGFQMVSLFNDEFVSAGNFNPTSTDVGTSMVSGRSYIEHRGPKNFQNGVAEWIFEWEAPVVEEEQEVTVFTAGMIGNGSGSSGDAVRFTDQSTLVRPVLVDLEVSIEGNDILCNGESSNLQAIVTGGAEPYSYLWSNGVTTSTNEGVFAGTYDVTVTDANDSMEVATIDLLEPSEVLIEVVVEDESAIGAMDGTASANVTGGTEPYNIEWSNDQTSDQITGLSEGSYSLIVTDGNGCTSSAFFEIDAPCAFEINLQFSQITCVGANDGEATIDPAGFVQPLSFSWSNGDNSFIAIAGLSPGEYAVSVSDGTGCETVESFTIAEPEPLEVNLVSQFPDCENPAVNTLSAEVTGGSGTYSYLWGNGASTSSLSNVVDGTYSVTVTDENACVASAELDFTFADTQGPEINFTDSVSVYVDSLGNLDFSAFNIEVTDNCEVDSEGFASDLSCEGLESSVIQYIASDVSGNMTAVSIFVAAVIDTFPPSVMCVDDIIQNGCDTIFYELPIANDNCGIAEMELAEGLPSGSVFPKDSTKVTYNYYDEAGNFACCSFWVVISNDLTLDIDAVNDATSESGGSISITVGGGSGNFTYEWILDDTVIVSSFEDVTGLVPGSYIVKVTDQSGCVITSDAILVELGSSVNNEVLNTNRIYPNPASDQLTLEFTGTLRNIIVMNINGQVVSTTVQNEKEGSLVLDVGSLQSGMYFISLQFEKGYQVLKFMKE